MNTRISKGRLWTSWIMSGLVILFMLFDGIMKLFKPAVVVESTIQLGFQEHHIVIMGVLALISTILYALPRTSFLGVVLLTGYFGGVIVTHLRLDAPLFSNTLFPVYLAVLAWGGIWLRNEQVRKLIPFQK
ncbi:DoxX family protein [Paenibacillus sp. FSL H8-0537]|uniref:DoxX family protein n=1 Tax=Paenibacillus sp. FSL H8-0537 TaxID=2921399 RepID=UPI0031012166